MKSRPPRKDAEEKLAPGGVVLIKVPNHNCLNRKVRQGRWCGFRYPDQVNYFTPETLGGMIRRSGLTLYRMRWYDRWPTNDNMYAAARAERLA